MGFFGINSKNLSKLRKLCQSLGYTKLAPKKKRKTTPNPILVMNNHLSHNSSRTLPKSR